MQEQLTSSIGAPMTASDPDDKSSKFALTDLINDKWPAIRGIGAVLSGIRHSPETLLQSRS